MNKLLFLQPALPKYRIDFFDELKKISKLNIFICHSDTDFLNVASVEYDSSIIVGKFYKIGPFYWQSKLGIPKLDKNDILVVSGNPRIINYMLLFFYYKFKGIKVIWWGQGWTAGKRGITSKIRRYIMSFSDGIAVYTEDEAQEINHNNIIGLNNGLKITKFVPLEKKMDQYEDIQLFFIGRLTNKSNLIVLLKALINVKRNYHLHIIGDGEIKDELMSFSCENKLNHNITWYGKVYDDIQIKKIADKCHLFIYPGSVGLSIIHAFSMGLPALIHNEIKLHMPEIAAFKNGYNGIYFDYNDINSLSAIIEKISILDINNMSLNARKTVENSFNTKDMAKRFSVLIKVLNEKNIG
ncbi:hypothetical protein EQ875_03844 [Photobacterium damselae subsp. damselae]|uniref:glycosyltransferase family 4 protein n=1 Tax=Photobacterium damselae TaxID=38293 RepID=UPI00109BB606|nr:glycosyltransferase family 4 protein [Photobacterium damselae]TGZ32609.1 hypothetical protein EQ875_03844 [Photobacterium damselae subsp. damselae]